MTLGKFRRITGRLEDDFELVFVTECLYMGDVEIASEKEIYVNEICPGLRNDGSPVLYLMEESED